MVNHILDDEAAMALSFSMIERGFGEVDGTSSILFDGMLRFTRNNDTNETLVSDLDDCWMASYDFGMISFKSGDLDKFQKDIASVERIHAPKTMKKKIPRDVE